MLCCPFPLTVFVCQVSQHLAVLLPQMSLTHNRVVATTHNHGWVSLSKSQSFMFLPAVSVRWQNSLHFHWRPGVFFPCIFRCVAHQGIWKFSAAFANKIAEQFYLLFIISLGHCQIHIQSKLVELIQFFHVLERLLEFKHSVCGSFSPSMAPHGSLTLAARTSIRQLSSDQGNCTQTETSSAATMLKSVTSSQEAYSLLTMQKQPV